MDWRMMGCKGEGDVDGIKRKDTEAESKKMSEKGRTIASRGGGIHDESKAGS